MTKSIKKDSSIRIKTPFYLEKKICLFLSLVEINKMTEKTLSATLICVSINFAPEDVATS